MKPLLYRWVLSPARLAYYRAFRPRTTGVKLVIQDARTRRILVVRHSYGNREVWHVPGGGYRARAEAADAAARREIREELGLEVSALTHLGEYRSERFGNRDTAQIFATLVEGAEVRPSPEIAEYRWASRRTILDELRIYGVTRHALGLLEGR